MFANNGKEVVSASFVSEEKAVERTAARQRAGVSRRHVPAEENERLVSVHAGGHPTQADLLQRVFGACSPARATIIGLTALLAFVCGCAGPRAVCVVVEIRPPVQLAEKVDAVARVEYRWDGSPR